MIHGFKYFLYLVENKIEFLANKHNVPQDDVTKIASADPTPKRKHLEWLVQQHKKGNLDISNPESIQQHKDVLTDFSKHNIKDDTGKLKGIHTFNDINHVKDEVDTHINNKLSEDFGKRVFSRNGHEIWESTTKKHAENHGCTTNWCTSIKNGLHQAKYFGEDKPPLYTHYPPGAPKPGSKEHSEGGERYQFYAGEEGHSGTEYGKKPELATHDNKPKDMHDHQIQFPDLAKSPHWNNFKEKHGEWQERVQENGIAGNDYDDEDEDIDALATSHDHNDRVRAVELGAHEDGLHAAALFNDPHPAVKEAILDYHHHGRNTPGGRDIYQNAMNRIHQNTPLEGEHNSEIHFHIAKETTNPDILHKYATHNWGGEYSILRQVAANEKTKPEDLTHIAKHYSNPTVNREIASNRNTPDEAIHHIMKHNNNHADTYAHILSRPNGMKHIDDIIHNHGIAGHMGAVHMTDDPTHLAHLAKSPSLNVKEFVANKAPHLLYNHESAAVRRAAARGIVNNINLGTSTVNDNMHMIKHLIHNDIPDKSIYSKETTNILAQIKGHHPELHKELLHSASQQDDNGILTTTNVNNNIVIGSVLSNTNDHSIVHSFIGHKNSNISQAARENIHRVATTPEQENQSIEKLAHSPHNTDKQTAARLTKNPDTLHHLATTENHGFIDINIARNPNTSNVTLDHLRNVKYANQPRNGAMHQVLDDVHNIRTGR